jgi:hypothetical protein
LKRKKALVAAIAAIAIGIVLVSSFVYMELTQPSIAVSFLFQAPDVNPSHFGFIYQNGTTNYNGTAYTNTTCLLYDIFIHNFGNLPLHNVTLYTDGATSPLMLGHQDESNNFEFLPFNTSFYPIAESFGTINPKEASGGSNMAIAVRTPNQAGAYQIQCRLESTEKSFPFSITVYTVIK